MKSESRVCGAASDDDSFSFTQVKEALQSMAADENREFLEAQRLAPHLVDTESQILHYLKCYDYDVQVVAGCIAKYWTRRKHIFGERAFLSLLDLSGAGAMSTDDLEHLAIGSGVPLPNDTEGCSVFCFDPSRNEAEDAEMSWTRGLRCFFFWMQVASSNEKSQTEGVVFVRVLDTIRWSKKLGQLLDLMDRTFALKLKAIHYCLPQSNDGGISSLIKRTFPYWTTGLVGFLTPTTEFHGGPELLSELTRHGLSKESIPEKLGGSWSYDNFDKWMEINTPRTGQALKKSSVYTGPKPKLSAISEEAYFSLAQEMHQFEKWSESRCPSRNKGPAEGVGAPVPRHDMNAPENYSAVRHLQWDSLTDDAITLLPKQESAAYFEAKEEMPDLVKVESNPHNFMEFEQFDALAASKRLAAYWKHRKKLFGPKTLLPMVSVGTGALSSEEVLALQSEKVTLLPACRNGSCVLYCDGTRVADLTSSEALYRTMFYLACIGTDFFRSKNKLVILISFNAPQSLPGSLESVQEFLGMLDDGFPIESIHFLTILKDTSQAARQDSIAFNASSHVQYKLRGKTFVHVAHSPAEALLKLEPHGFTVSGLPSNIGGTWINGTFKKMLVHKNLEEMSRLAKPSMSKITGSGNETVQESPFVVRHAIQQLEGAFDFIAEDEKKDYLEALRRVPGLVFAESPPLRFLRFEKFNAWAAAQRLACYWKWRKKIFKGKAFLPMTQFGAIGDDVVRTLSSGYFIILPRDKSGRPVACLDPSKRINYSLDTRLRLSFYLWTILCEYPLACTEGYIGIVLMGQAGAPKSSFDSAITVCSDMVREAFPTRHQHLHLVHCRAKSEGRSFLRLILPTVLKVLGAMVSHRTSFHSKEGHDEMVKKLETFGLDGASLPKCCGGSLSDDYKVLWRADRLQAERESHNTAGPSLRLLMSAALDNEGSPTVHEPNASGVTASTVGTGEQAQLAIERALGALPVEKKNAMEEAARRNTELHSFNSSYARYLRYANNDPEVAAQKMASYWQTRKSIFGNKFVLPLTQTGEGALGRRELNLLGTGFFSLLPKDQEGNSVVCFDPSKLVKASLDCRLRVMFYVLDLAASNAQSRQGGVVMVCLINKVKAERGKKLNAELVLNSLPIHIRAVHLIQSYAEGQPLISREKGLASMRQVFGHVVDERVIFHDRSTKGSIVEAMRREGLSKEGLPKTIGGEWGFEHFIQWMELQTRLEWNLPAGSGGKNTAERMFDFTGVKPLQSLSEEERKERKRRMNVVHSRRKRERERIEIEVLQEQCTDLSDRNLELSRKNASFEELLSEAQIVISRVGQFSREQDLRSIAADQVHSERLAPGITEPVTGGGIQFASRAAPFNFSLGSFYSRGSDSQDQHWPAPRQGSLNPSLQHQIQSPFDQGVRTALLEENETLRWTIRELQRRQLEEELGRQELEHQLRSQNARSPDGSGGRLGSRIQQGDQNNRNLWNFFFG